jgi:hypothetical protein
VCGCREKRVKTKEKYKLRLTTKAYKLSYNYLKLHHKSSWQIAGQVTSQAPVFWHLKEGEEGVVRVCSEIRRVLTMKHNTQNRWVIGLCPSFGIVYN